MTLLFSPNSCTLYGGLWGYKSEWEVVQPVHRGLHHCPLILNGDGEGEVTLEPPSQTDSE